MKKNMMIPMLAAAISLTVSVPAMAGHIYAGQGVEKTVTYDENGNQVITLIFDPAEMPDYMKPKAARQTQPKTEKKQELTEPPQIGVTLGYIYNEETERFTENYRSGNIGQCTWYARGRFREVHGIEMPYMGRAKEWLDTAYKTEELAVITDLTDVPEQAVAVYEPAEGFETWPGHVRFIEYVERDENGKPVNIYYTDANGVGDLQKGVYDEGYDGTVKVYSFEEFIEPYGLKLIGYIVPK